MNKIILKIEPFVLNQNCHIVSNNEIVSSYSIPTKELVSKIIYFSGQNGINEIDLVGSKKYNEKLKTQILEAYTQKYESNDIIINLV